MALQLKIEESLLQKLFRKILQRGPIPKHIAFILDGNRRYAKERNMKTIDGHRKGCDKFDQIIDCAKICGVPEVTAYVFSIDNFNRTEDEVAGIMALFMEKLEFKLKHPEDREGICYRAVGNWSLYPNNLRTLIAKLMIETKHNTKIVVNVGFVYTGRDEITAGVNTLLKGLQVDDIDLDCINETLLNQSLHVAPMSTVDMLIRTGESRLSDFFTWESSDQAVLCFREQYWPTFSYWKFLAAIFYFQANRFYVLPHASVSRVSDEVAKSDKNSPQISMFLRKKTMVDWNSIEDFANRLSMKEQFKQHSLQ